MASRSQLRPGVKVKKKQSTINRKPRVDGTVTCGAWSGEYYDPEDDSVHVRWDDGNSGWTYASEIEVIS